MPDLPLCKSNSYSMVCPPVCGMCKARGLSPVQLDNHGILRNSYIMGCPPVRGDNPRDLASELSYVQVDKHGITNLYHLHQCRPCTSRDISC